jgi:hypothetical protein
MAESGEVDFAEIASQIESLGHEVPSDLALRA